MNLAVWTICLLYDIYDKLYICVGIIFLRLARYLNLSVISIKRGQSIWTSIRLGSFETFGSNHFVPPNFLCFTSCWRRKNQQTYDPRFGATTSCTLDLRVFPCLDRDLFGATWSWSFIFMPYCKNVCSFIFSGRFWESLCFSTNSCTIWTKWFQEWVQDILLSERLHVLVEFPNRMDLSKHQTNIHYRRPALQHCSHRTIRLQQVTFGSPVLDPWGWTMHVFFVAAGHSKPWEDHSCCCVLLIP